MTDNPFDDAMDGAEDSDKTESVEDLEELWEAASAGGTSKTIGVGVNEELHQIYKELRDAEDVDVDLAQSFRDHILTVAKRHPETAEKAHKMLQVKRGEL